MGSIRWEFYPLVAQDEHACSWLRIQANLQLAATTIDAYGRSLNDYLGFCRRQQIQPQALTREHVALYVQDLASRPNPRGSKLILEASTAGLSYSTMQQRITVARLYHDYLVEQQLRPDNPVHRGHYVAGKSFGGMANRGLIPTQHRLPWIPSDQEWKAFLHTLKQEPLRNRLMLLLAYDGALRRQEVVTVEIGDFDFACRQVRIQASHAKNGSERIVSYSSLTSQLLQAYLQQRRLLSPKPGALFLSESRRNCASPLSLIMWSKIVQKLAGRAGLPRFTTHTPRHLRLTHFARAGLDLHQIATYAGHRSLQTTMLYIHLSGIELTAAVRRSLASFDHFMSTLLEETIR
jgi:integrase/recombinase XerD